MKRNIELKDQFDTASKYLKILKEKNRQTQLKLDDLNKSAKTLNEQIKKIQIQKDQKDKLYKTDRNKLDKEIEKLKNRISVLSNAKSKELQSLFY